MPLNLHLHRGIIVLGRQLLALEVAVLVGVGRFEQPLVNAPGVLSHRVSLVDVDVQADPANRDLNVAVGKLADFRPFGQPPIAPDAGRRPTRA